MGVMHHKRNVFIGGNEEGGVWQPWPHYMRESLITWGNPFHLDSSDSYA